MADAPADDVAPRRRPGNRKGQPGSNSSVAAGVAAGRLRRKRGTPGHACERCGQVHYGCKAHSRKPFRPCGKWPMHGQEVCETHGGKAPNNLRAGAVRWAAKVDMQRAERAVRTFGLPLKVDPQQALLDEIYRTAGHVQWLAGVIGNMEQEEIVWNKASEERQSGIGVMGDAVDMTTEVKQARPAVWMELYQKERAHLVHVCKVAIQCGIAERQVRLAEEQGNAIAGMLRQLFESEELQLTAVQITAARTVGAKLLRQMRIGSQPPFAVLKALPGGDGENGGSDANG